MDLDIERRSSHRVRSFDPAELDAPRRPYFNESSNANGTSWEQLKNAYKDGRSRSGSIQSPRPPRHVVVPAPAKTTPEKQKARHRSRSKSVASPSRISVSSSSRDDKESTFSAATSADSDSTSSSASTSSDSSSTGSTSFSTSSTSSDTDSETTSDDSSDSSSDTSSSTSSSDSSPAQAQKNLPTALARVAGGAREGEWRPSYNDESIAAAAAAAAILEKERELKLMELDLIKEKRDFAKEVKRRASAPTLFEREEDALAQMQRLVRLEGGELSLDAYLAATEKTATFMDDSSASVGVGNSRRRRDTGAATANDSRPRLADEANVRGDGMNRVSAYQAQQRLTGSTSARVGVLSHEVSDTSSGIEDGGLNNSGTVRLLTLDEDAESSSGAPHTHQLMYENVVKQLATVTPPNVSSTAAPPTARSGTPAQSITITVPSPAQKSLSLPSPANEPPPPVIVVPATPAVPASPSAAKKSLKGSAPSAHGVTVTLAAASPLNDQLSPSGAGSGEGSPTYSGTPAAVYIQSDHHRSDTSASRNEMPTTPTPEPRKPTRAHRSTPSTSLESLAAPVEAPDRRRVEKAKKRVRVRVRRRSRSRRKSRASVATETEAETEAESDAEARTHGKRPPQFLSPTPVNQLGGQDEGSPRRRAWLMPPPAESGSPRSGVLSSSHGTTPRQPDLSPPPNAEPQYVQVVIGPAAVRTSQPAQGQRSSRRATAQTVSWASAPASWPMSEPPPVASGGAGPSAAAESLRYLTASGPVTDRQFKKLLCAEYVPAASSAEPSRRNSQRHGYEPFSDHERRSRQTSSVSEVRHGAHAETDDSFVVNSPPSSVEDAHVLSPQSTHSAQRPTAAEAGVSAAAAQSAVPGAGGAGPWASGGHVNAVSAGATSTPAQPPQQLTSPSSTAARRFTALSDDQPPRSEVPAAGLNAVDSDGSVIEFPPPPPTRAPDMPGMDYRFPTAPSVANAAAAPEDSDDRGCCGRCCHRWTRFLRCVFCCACRSKSSPAGGAAASPNPAPTVAHNSLGLGAVAPVMAPEVIPEDAPRTEAVMR